VTVPGTALGNANPDDNPVFLATVEGGETQEFLTLQRAMTWVEDYENPTAVITFMDQPVIRYTKGAVDAVGATGPP
jgi:hypothetical protein